MKRFLAHRDLVLALAFLAFGALEIAAGGTYEGQPNWPGSKPVAAIGLVLMTLPLAWRRRHATAAAVVVFGAVIIDSLAVGAIEGTTLFLACLVASFSLAAYAARPWLLAVLPFAAMSAHNVVDTAVTGWNDYFWSGGMIAVALLLGAAVRNKQIRIVSLEAEAARHAREHEARVAAATAAERAAIARELHDIVAHAVSVIVVQAQAGSRAVHDDSATTARLLEVIESTGRSALDDLRRLLRVLSTEEHPADPSPGLAQVGTLVERFRRAGLRVTLSLPDPLPALSSAADLAAYRLVQEALTNTVKHAAGARAEVVVSAHAGLVEVRVTDLGGSGGGADHLGSGRGLIGMRERVDLAGGRLLACGGVEGGFQVVAELPAGADQTVYA